MTEEELREVARQLRREIVEIAYKAPMTNHPGPALSCIDIVTALYFEIMNLKPQDPEWEERDRFILSKGHACPALYAALAKKGFFPESELKKVRGIGCMLQGHPDMKRIPGIDMTTGSLGNGLSAGIGMAIYAKANRKSYHVYVVVGDGECQEGAIWEGAIVAAAKKLDNLICIVDANGWQSCGSVEAIAPMRPFEEKWSAFGWNVFTIDGHDMGQLVDTLRKASQAQGRPAVIVAQTVKGKGVSFMENNNAWHSRRPTEDEYKQAVRDAEEGGR